MCGAVEIAGESLKLGNIALRVRAIISRVYRDCIISETEALDYYDKVSTLLSNGNSKGMIDLVHEIHQKAK